MTEIELAALELLKADDQRIAHNVRQPPSDDDGKPYDAQAWLVWLHESVLVNERTERAYGTLVSLGVEIPRYHSLWYRPVAEDIVRRAFCPQCKL